MGEKIYHRFFLDFGAKDDKDMLQLAFFAEVYAGDMEEAKARALNAKVMDVMSTHQQGDTGRLAIECAVDDPHVTRYCVCIEPKNLVLHSGFDGKIGKKKGFKEFLEKLRQHECEETMAALARQGETERQS